MFELEALVAPHHHVKYRIIDINHRATYDGLVSDSDVVIRCESSLVYLTKYLTKARWSYSSLLPANMHPIIAQVCIAHGTHLVTASYVSPEMQALNNLYALNRVSLPVLID